MINFKTQYDKRKSLGRVALMRNGWQFPKDLDEEVYNELKQGIEYLGHSNVEKTFKELRLYWNHSVVIVGENKFRSVTYSDHAFNHFKIMQDTGLLSDYYTFDCMHGPFSKTVWTQYDENHLLKAKYHSQHPLEVKVTDDNWTSVMFTGNNILMNKHMHDAYTNIANYIPKEDYMMLSWGIKEHGLIIEIGIQMQYNRTKYFRPVDGQPDIINNMSKVGKPFNSRREYAKR